MNLGENRLEQVMRLTGFQKATAERPTELGQWFELQRGMSLPEYFSDRSFQNGPEDEDGWRPARDNYPDLFIHPQNSVVLTVNAFEIVRSEDYSCGLTLRFPRATRVRTGEDEKAPNDIANEDGLFRMYTQYQQMLQSPNAIDMGAVRQCKFMTVEDIAISKKNIKKRTKKHLFGALEHASMAKIPKESVALQGVKFHVLEGCYFLDEKSIDAEEAKAEGWYEEVSKEPTKVIKAASVEQFILKHGGTILFSPGPDTCVIGGHVKDTKVNSIMK